MINIPQRLRRPIPIIFMWGGQLFQIARSPDGQGYVGYRDGRLVSRELERGEVARRLLAAPQGRPSA
jgi:hypothetical protein